METSSGDADGLAEGPAKTMMTEGQKEIAAENSEAPHGEDVPDPEEDDLDDLDDMLDAFSPVKNDAKKSSPTKPDSPKPAATQVVSDTTAEDGPTDENFAKQLQAGMADLLGDLGSDADMKAQFENMLKELGNGSELESIPDVRSRSTDTASKAGPTSTSEEQSFQETIRKTMERMQASEGKATAAATDDDSDDMLAELMKQMSSGALGTDGSEEDFSKMLLGMMEQLTNKEILYEPMKELNDKFPSWMESNRASTTKEDLKRYEEQQTLVKEIVAKFEERAYSDDNAADREYIVDRMQKMQGAGSPPPDLVGDMAAAQEALAGPEEGCPQQ
ncbi:MAG: Peroxisome chaperone and import receptor [Claussenomyces sp. TS43310]|nr:MAG: Peroxisome chaperone and import receptor [Claussenomyces sp. TS43310]